MRVYETGSIPVHIALSEIASEGLELFSNSDIKREIESCYQQYTPRQNRPIFSGDAAWIQHETDMSWDIHHERELDEELLQSLDEYDDEPIIRAYMDEHNGPHDDSVELQPTVTSTRAIRRKQNAKHNRRMRNAVIIDYKGSKSRFNVDFYYKAVINRRIVCPSMCRTGRYANLLKQAQKKKLITTAELAAS